MTISSEKSLLGEFFRTEYSKLLGFVRRRVDYIAAQEAEDIVHDVVVHLFDKADVTAPIEHLSAYVYRSLQNRIADYFRKRRLTGMQLDTASEELPSLDKVVEESGYYAVPEIRQMEMAHDLYRLLDGLDDEEKSLILASDIQGQTFNELSKKWHVPINTLLSRKSRALGKIRRQIQAKKKEEDNE